jgi:hypothetical protein
MFYVGLEVLTEVIMKSAMFLDITQYNLLTVSQHFAGICDPYLRPIIKSIGHPPREMQFSRVC